jgi:hypothetical protein
MSSTLTEQSSAGSGKMNDQRTGESFIAATGGQGHAMTSPDLASTDRRAPVARWMMGLAEPLLSTERRVALDVEMAAFCASHSTWAVYWFAGFIDDVVSTLPPEDPWRGLSATLDLAALSLTGEPDLGQISFDNPLGRPPPDATGAVLPDGRAFGTSADSDDLLIADIGPPTSDIGVVALAEPLDPVSAALAGFATAGVDRLHQVLGQVARCLHVDGQDQPEAAARFLSVMAPVLRRFIHRRRTYTGPEDPFPLVVGFAWMARADRLVAGQGKVSSELGLAAEGALPPGTYDDLRL